MRQFFMALPNELEDAARIDGCNHFMIFSRIMFPLVKPGLVALAILTLRSAWNDLMWPMIVNTSPEKMTLSAGLSYLQGQYATDYPVMMQVRFLQSFHYLYYLLFSRSSLLKESLYRE